MEIRFEQINKKYVDIIGINDEGEERIIGIIFTPSGSASDVKNAIQVCGFDEAFDFWGCGLFQKLKNKKERIANRLEESKKQDWKSAKDIQLMFSFDTRNKEINDIENICLACFNNPCDCENKVNDKKTNPFNVKREEELKDRLEYMEKGKLDYEKKRKIRYENDR